MEAAAMHDPGEVREAQSGALVLIVDDARSNQLVLEALLAREGHRSVSAADGREAVELYRELRPDLVLMDVMMPEMDGYEATRRIKALAGDEFVPVIFLTALSDEESLANCVQAGGDDFLSKPYSHVLLSAKVDAALRNRQLYATMKRQRDELNCLDEVNRQDMLLAEKIYYRLARHDTLERDNLQWVLRPMDVLNGDVMLAAENPTGEQYFLLGDFTGHGLPAAVGALVVFDVFYAMAAKGFALVEILKEINRKLKLILPVGRFMAACAIQLSASRERAMIWNGGIPQVMYWAPREGVKQTIASRHLPLGIVDSNTMDLDMDCCELDRDEYLVVYSDGLIETPNPRGEMVGTQRLIGWLNDPQVRDPYLKLLEALSDFQEDAPQADDISLMVIAAKAPPDDETVELQMMALKDNVRDWACTMELGPDALRTVDPLPLLVQQVEEIQGLGIDRQKVYLILTELFSNALEHGLLGLDSDIKQRPGGFATYYGQRQKVLEGLREGRIRLEVRQRPLQEGGELVLRVCHDGKGFDIRAPSRDLSENTSFSGRGVSLVRALSKSLVYRDEGREAEVTLNQRLGSGAPEISRR